VGQSLAQLAPRRARDTGGAPALRTTFAKPAPRAGVTPRMTPPRSLAALAERHAALRAEVAETARELEEPERLLADTRRRQRLPVLEALRVSSPCRADWSKMAGDDRVRHCDTCKQYVYNLSAMTSAEALELIESLERAPCVRYYGRPDGTVLFRDCSVTRSRRRRSRVLAAGVALAVGAGMAALADLPPDDEPAYEEAQVVMGAIAPDPSDPEEAPAVELSEAELEAAERALPEAEQRALAVEWAEDLLRGSMSGPR
jgi:hypothetical protein